MDHPSEVPQVIGCRIWDAHCLINAAQELGGDSEILRAEQDRLAEEGQDISLESLLRLRSAIGRALELGYVQRPRTSSEELLQEMDTASLACFGDTAGAVFQINARLADIFETSEVEVDEPLSHANSVELRQMIARLFSLE